MARLTDRVRDGKKHLALQQVKRVRLKCPTAGFKVDSDADVGGGVVVWGPIALPQVESMSHQSENVPMLICSPLLTWQRLLFSVLPLLPLQFLFHPLLSSPSSSRLLFTLLYLLLPLLSLHLPFLSLSLFTSCSSLLHFLCLSSPSSPFPSVLSLLPF